MQTNQLQMTGMLKINYNGNVKLTISDKDVTWRVNTNGDRLYKGKYYHVRNYNPLLGKRFDFDKQWIMDGLETPVNPSNDFHMLQIALNLNNP